MRAAGGIYEVAFNTIPENYRYSHSFIFSKRREAASNGSVMTIVPTHTICGPSKFEVVARLSNRQEIYVKRMRFVYRVRNKTRPSQRYTGLALER
jgi:hypothetical protein